MANDQPVIYFKSYEIEKFNYMKVNPDEKIDDSRNDDSFTVSVKPSYDVERKNAALKVDVVFATGNMKIDITVNGYFELIDDTQVDFEKLLVINGSAIIFPYIRSMVSMLTSLDNEHAIILPTINTNNLWHKD